MTVRKNFNFDEQVARHLEEIARHEKKTMTEAVQEAIEEKYRRIFVKRRKKALQRIIESATPGSVGTRSIQELKAETDV